MAPTETLRPYADRLAGLLSDARGAQILAQLQKLALLERGGVERRGATGPADPDHIGIWRIEENGGAALRRRTGLRGEEWAWADVDYVPPAGAARRVVLLGESTARGWVYHPVFTPSMVLARHLDAAAPGGYQCVDLARSGAVIADLNRIVDQLPRLRPDVVVSFAGSNCPMMPTLPEIEMAHGVAAALRDGGYPAMRQAFIDTVVLPRVRSYLDRLAALQDRYGTRIVMVIPEFNLRCWAPPREVEAPTLPPEMLSRWYALLDEVEQAGDQRRWADVPALTDRMRELDGGVSPIPGYLAGLAAIERGDGASARSALETARDAVVGIGIFHTPRIIREVQQLLTGFAVDRGLRCVDLRTELASADLPELPDDRLFHDYCHLSDEGIEKAMSAVADAVLERPAGTTEPGPGVPAPFRAFVRMLAAAHNAYHGQPVETLRPHVRAALAADPRITATMTALLDVLDATGPVWTHAGIESLTEYRHAAAIFGPMLLSPDRPPSLWPARAALGEALGRTPTTDADRIDLLATADSRGHTPPNLAPGRGYRQATSRQTLLAFALAQPRRARLELTYRMPDAPAAPDGAPAEVFVGTHRIGALPAAPGWTTATLDLPETATVAAVNWLRLRWPLPVTDPDGQRAADIAALARGEFPFVLPVFGELFEARLILDGTDR